MPASITTFNEGYSADQSVDVGATFLRAFVIAREHIATGGVPSVQPATRRQLSRSLTGHRTRALPDGGWDRARRGWTGHSPPGQRVPPVEGAPRPHRCPETSRPPVSPLEPTEPAARTVEPARRQQVRHRLLGQGRAGGPASPSLNITMICGVSSGKRTPVPPQQAVSASLGNQVESTGKWIGASETSWMAMLLSSGCICA